MCYRHYALPNGRLPSAKRLCPKHSVQKDSRGVLGTRNLEEGTSEILGNRELTNRRLSHGDTVRMGDMTSVHAYMGTSQSRTKVVDVSEGALQAHHGK